MAKRRKSKVQSMHPVFPRRLAVLRPATLAHLDEDSSLSSVTLLGQQSRRWRMEVQMPARISLCGIGVLITLDGDGHAWAGEGTLEVGVSEMLCVGSADWHDVVCKSWWLCVTAQEPRS